MPCYRPVTVWKPEDGGAISFRELKNHREMEIPCGKCIGCRIEIVDGWAFRCMAESRMHEHNHFVTLTYDDEHLPENESLDHREWQLFAKRLRKNLAPFRFFMCGEYGERTGRPHYHALLFGLDIPDLVKCNSVYSQSDLCKSEMLSKAWGKGECVIGHVTHASARYCAMYTTKRVSEELEAERYAWVTRFGEHVVRAQPYGKMSLRPGIGREWFDRYWKDVANHGAVYTSQYAKKIPRYFNVLMEDLHPEEHESMQMSRTAKALEFIEDKTRERLQVREAVALAKRKFDKQRFPNAL